MVTLSEQEENIYPNINACPALKRWAKMSFAGNMLQIHSDYQKNRQQFMEDLKIDHEKRFAFVHIRDFLAAQEVIHSFCFQ